MHAAAPQTGREQASFDYKTHPLDVCNDLVRLFLRRGLRFSRACQASVSCVGGGKVIET
jgi:hypothetical protein